MTLHTTEPDATNGKGFHGTVFSGGTGIYVEARMALPNLSSITIDSWPSFWSEDIKVETGLNYEMPKHPLDYESIENDFMEFNPNWGTLNAYISTVHDFSGTFASGGPSYDISNSNSILPVSAGNRLHAVPHVRNALGAGECREWLDGLPAGVLRWRCAGRGLLERQPGGDASPVGSNIFSLLDGDQFDMIFGGCATGIPSLQVDYVHVYAVSASSVTVVPAGPTGKSLGTAKVSGIAGSNVTFSFAGLAGDPDGAIYVWYRYGIEIATTTTPFFTIDDFQPSQAGAYTVFATAPGSRGRSPAARRSRSACRIRRRPRW